MVPLLSVDGRTSAWCAREIIVVVGGSGCWEEREDVDLAGVCALGGADTREDLIPRGPRGCLLFVVVVDAHGHVCPNPSSSNATTQPQQHQNKRILYKTIGNVFDHWHDISFCLFFHGRHHTS